MENVYAPPKSQLIDINKPFQLCADEKYVVTKADTNWGNCCCYCNEQAEEKVGMKIHYYPLWAKFFGFIFVLVTPLALELGVSIFVFLVVSALFILAASTYLASKSIKVQIPLCVKHRKLRRLQQILALLFLAVVCVMLYLSSKLQCSTLWVYCFVLALIALIVVSIKWLPKPLVSERRLEDMFWVKGVDKAFRDKLPEFH